MFSIIKRPRMDSTNGIQGGEWVCLGMNISLARSGILCVGYTSFYSTFFSDTKKLKAVMIVSPKSNSRYQPPGRTGRPTLAFKPKTRMPFR